MALYELRTYTLRVGTMAEAVKLYQKIGFPALQKGGHDKKLVGYFQADTGTINQLLHLWKFDDDDDRRAHWAAVYANKEFVEGFASKFRPLLMTQEVKLLQAAPWDHIRNWPRRGGWRAFRVVSDGATVRIKADTTTPSGKAMFGRHVVCVRRLRTQHYSGKGARRPPKGAQGGQTPRPARSRRRSSNASWLLSRLLDAPRG